MARNSPAIIIKAHGSSSVRGFSNYITREEALKQEREDIEKFFKYAANEAKTKENGIFTQDKIGVGEKEKIEFVERSANYLTRDTNQKKFMYKDVLSFDNDYLREKNLIHSNGEVDVNKLSKIVQGSYQQHANRLGMTKDYQLLGAVHLNTDNIHVHVGIVDKKFNEKYTRPEKSLREIKSTTISAIEKENRIDLQKNIDRNRQLLKHGILKDLSIKPNEQQLLLDKIKESLPNDKSLHRMKSNAKSMQQPKELVKKYIDKELQKNYKSDFEKFKKDLTKEQRYNERLYGQGKSNNSYQTKLDRFYEETGNKIFKDLASQKDIDTTKEKATPHNEPLTRLNLQTRNTEHFEQRKNHTTMTFKRTTENSFDRSTSKRATTHVKSGFSNLLKAVSKSKVGVRAPETNKQKQQTIEQAYERER